MHKDKQKIAIIGSGLSGSVLAHSLHKTGVNVTVFDKSRGTGGRLSSCRTTTIEADLGAPYFEPQSTEFREWLSSRKTIENWHVSERDFHNPQHETKTYLTASPKQSMLTRELLNGCELRTETLVNYLWPETNAVVIRDHKGQVLGHYDKVVVATPAQQAAHLLEAVPRFSKKARGIAFKSRWVLILRVKVQEKSPVQIISGHHPILFRCIKNCSKPSRNASESYETWVIEANDDWSQQNLDVDSAIVAEKLSQTFIELMDLVYEPEICRIHRWLYSSHQNAHEGFLWDPQTNIGACGDWLCAGQSEGAWMSAELLAAQLKSEIRASTEMQRALI